MHAFGAHSTAEDVTEGLDLTGRTYLVTGASSGLGLETVRVLALRGARVLAAARTEAKAQAALQEAGASGGGLALELSEPRSVRRAVAAVLERGEVLDGLIANAGIMALPELEVHHGLERQFLVNHLGHFGLVTGLLGALAPQGRVVVVSSLAHLNTPPTGVDLDNLDGTAGYHAWRFYGQSKLANILFARALARRLEGTEQVALSLHPGVIRTNLARHLPDPERVFSRIPASQFKDIPQGAATQVFAATHPSMAQASGAYLDSCAVRAPSDHAQDDALGERLWERSEALWADLA